MSINNSDVKNNDNNKEKTVQETFLTNSEPDTWVSCRFII